MRVTRPAADRASTLADRLAHPAPLAPVEVATIGAQVATVLAEWHRGGACHLDLGPDRLEVDAAGGRLQVRILPPAPGTPSDTLRYRAPEQLSDRPVGPAADVYALGVVLLDGLVGARAHPPAVPDDIGSAWRYLLAGMIAASPADRPTAEAVAQTLEQVPGVAVAAVADPPTPDPVVDDAPRSKLLPGGAHVEPVPIDLPKQSRLARLKPPIPGRRKPPEPDVRH
jgi:eukaryotic-like serine/threonine-protein kinase